MPGRQLSVAGSHTIPAPQQTVQPQSVEPLGQID
jgi:hypothetical protein